MKNYHFVIMLDNARPNTEGLEDRLFEAGCDDALVCALNNSVYLEFDREAESAEQALTSAIKQVHAADFQIKCIQEAGPASMADLARLANTTRASISNYILGKRGKGDFPAPIGGISLSTPLYSWPEVARWLHQNNKLEDTSYEVAEAAQSFSQEQSRYSEDVSQTHP